MLKVEADGIRVCEPPWAGRPSFVGQSIADPVDHGRLCVRHATQKRPQLLESGSISQERVNRCPDHAEVLGSGTDRPVSSYLCANS